MSCSSTSVSQTESSTTLTYDDSIEGQDDVIGNPRDLCVVGKLIEVVFEELDKEGGESVAGRVLVCQQSVGVRGCQGVCIHKNVEVCVCVCVCVCVSVCLSVKEQST